MSMFEPFLDSTRYAMMLTQEIVRRYGGDCVDTEHIVLALLEVDESALFPLFEERGLSIDAYRERLARGPHPPKGDLSELTFSAEAKQLFTLAFARAHDDHSNFVSDEHLLAALASIPDCKGAQYLIELGFDLPGIARRMAEQLNVVHPAPQADLTALRRSYLRFKLDEGDLDANPLSQLEQWLAQATQAQLLEPYAMSVSTVGAQGQPSSRIVLLRGVSERGLVFYTSYLSRKGQEIGSNPRAAALLYWGELERQVRVEGTIEQVSDEESDAYFASRPRGHQLAAWASEQSEPLESRALIEQRVEDYTARFEGEDVPRPHSWGGYLIRPARIEFWQGRDNRVHDRFEFVKDGTSWRLQRLSP